MSLKDNLLFELESNRESVISGQAVATKYGVSRNAVCKAIKALKNEGYEIEATTNRGYKLSSDSDLISKEGIESNLSKKYKNLDIVFADKMDSTNNEAKRQIISQNNRNLLVVTNEQTNGRGRRGKEFFSPRSGAYMTLVIHPNVAINQSICVTSAAAVATVKAIKELTEKKPQIKWVNDIYLDDKKLAGILTEAVSDYEDGFVSNVLIGIGINFKSCAVPKEIEDKVAFLDSDGLKRNKLIALITENLLEITNDLTDLSFFDEYRKLSIVIGKKIIFEENGKMVECEAVDIDNNGELIVKLLSGKLRKLNSSRVSIKLK